VGLLVIFFMTELGIIEGTEIKVLSSKSGLGPILVLVKGNKFGIGKSVANKIIINK